MAFEETYQKFSTDNIFTGMIDLDGNIYNASMRNNRVKIGVDAEREQELLNQIEEMQGVIDNYYQKLVDLGAIIPPKTPEQIAQEQAEQQSLINQQLLEAIGSLQAELKEMKSNGNDGSSITVGNEQQGENRKNSRTVTKAGRGSSDTSKKDSSGDNA